MPDLDILSKVYTLSWRGILVPCQNNSTTFEHNQVEHYQPGVPGAFVENVFRRSATFSFKIPFRTGLADHRFPDLYPTIFRDFWNACLDGSVDELQHPEFGVIQARVKSLQLSVDINRRDGYDVDVVWVESNEESEGLQEASQSPLKKAESLAGALDEKTGLMDPEPEYDDGSGDDLFSAIKKLEGAMAIIDMTLSDIVNKINRVISAVNDLISLVNKATHPVSWDVANDLKLIEASLQEVKDNLSPNQKKIDFIVAQKDLELSQAAAGASMAIDAFLKLNPRLAVSKTIKKGKEYFVEVS